VSLGLLYLIFAVPDQPDRRRFDEWLHRSYLNFWAAHH
jgi:hypothetical protein